MWRSVFGQAFVNELRLLDRPTFHRVKRYMARVVEAPLSPCDNVIELPPMFRPGTFQATGEVRFLHLRFP